MSSKPISKVPNLAPSVVDKILRERAEMEEEAPSAPITYTPDGIKLTTKQGDRVSYDSVSVNDLAKASNIVTDPYKTKLEADNRHVTDKVYMNSPEFNELRRQLYGNYREVFELIGGYMVRDPFTFVDRMNTWLGTTVQFDSWNEAGICEQFLQALKNKSAGALVSVDIDKIVGRYRKDH